MIARLFVRSAVIVGKNWVIATALFGLLLAVTEFQLSTNDQMEIERSQIELRSIRQRVDVLSGSTELLNAKREEMASSGLLLSETSVDDAGRKISNLFHQIADGKDVQLININSQGVKGPNDLQLLKTTVRLAVPSNRIFDVISVVEHGRPAMQIEHFQASKIPGADRVSVDLTTESVRWPTPGANSR